MPDTSADRSIITLIRDGTLDTELAATLWLLIEARVPVIVAPSTRRSSQRPGQVVKSPSTRRLLSGRIRRQA